MAAGVAHCSTLEQPAAATSSSSLRVLAQRLPRGRDVRRIGKAKMQQRINELQTQCGLLQNE
eukprot:8814406-Karenia_brevis.AAC.1